MSDGESLNLSGTAAGHYDDLNDDWKLMMDSMKLKLNCHDEDDMTADRFKRLNKDILADWFVNFVRGLKSHRMLMLDLRQDLDSVKTELILSQDSVIKLQSEMLESQSNQLKAMQSTVQSTVQETVHAEIKSYSKALTDNVSASAHTSTFSAKNLKSVVRDIVDQEDRSRNLMIFGLKEEAGEQTDVKIEEILQRIGEKPTVEAVRVGQHKTDRARPVKVTLRTCSAVHQVLVKAKNLRVDDQYKDVFICPDRTPEERTPHKQLVLDLKSRLKLEHNRKHYIRSGRVISEDKDSTLS